MGIVEIDEGKTHCTVLFFFFFKPLLISLTNIPLAKESHVIYMHPHQRM